MQELLAPSLERNAFNVEVCVTVSPTIIATSILGSDMDATDGMGTDRLRPSSGVPHKLRGGQST